MLVTFKTQFGPKDFEIDNGFNEKLYTPVDPKNCALKTKLNVSRVLLI